MKAMSLAFALALLSACGRMGPEPDCVSDHGIEVFGFDCRDVEKWTLDVAYDFTVSPCPEAAEIHLLLELPELYPLLQAKHNQTVAHYWMGAVVAPNGERFKHELTHAVIAIWDLAAYPGWDDWHDEDNDHHTYMRECNLHY